MYIVLIKYNVQNTLNFSHFLNFLYFFLSLRSLAEDVHILVINNRPSEKKTNNILILFHHRPILKVFNNNVHFQPKYSCICDEGWTSSGSSPACTVDVDECSLQNPPCSTDPQVICINLPGSFHCGPCPIGKLISFIIFKK